MATTKHTPGPWKAEVGRDGAVIREQDSETLMTGPVVATVPANYVNPHLREGRANARLIATAPDMATLLESIQQRMRRGLGTDGMAAIDSEIAAVLTKAGVLP